MDLELITLLNSVRTSLSDIIDAIDIYLNGNPPPPPITATLTANPTSVEVGQTTVITWNTTNATTVTLDGQTVSASGNQTFTVNADHTFTLVASNSNETVTRTVNVTATIPAITASLTAVPSTINSGENTVVTWNTANATTITLDGQAVAANGNTTVNLTSSHTFTLVASNLNETVTRTAVVTVNTVPPPGGNNLLVGSGQTVTISSDVSYPDGISILAGGILNVANNVNVTVGKEFLNSGTLNAVGSERTRIVKAGGDMLAGQSVITLLNAVPLNWGINHPIKISDSRHLESTSGYTTHTEDRVITAINGNQITLNQPLQYDHLASRNKFGQIDDLPRIDNVDCTINFISDTTPGNRCHLKVHWNHAGGDPQPHMLIQDVKFTGFGRTTIDPVTDENGPNPIGEYDIHCHHIHAAGANIVIRRVVVDGQTMIHKWGIVLHETQGATIEECVVYNVGGAGIVTEDANAKNNIIRGNHCFDIRGNGDREDSNRAGLKFGTSGNGFYFQGLDNIIIDNVASSCVNRAGFALFGSGAIHDGNNLTNFNGNESYCCKRGIETWYMGADISTIDTACPEQIIDNLKTWHLIDCALFPYPMANVTLRNHKVRGTYVGWAVADYMQWKCRLVNPDYFSIVGIGIPTVIGHISVDPSEQTFVIQGGTIRCTSGCISNETTIGPSSGGATPRRTIIDGVLLDGDIYNIAMSFNPNGQVTLGDIVEVRNYQNVQGDNFNVYYLDNPNLPAPCTTQRPKIIGYVCP